MLQLTFPRRRCQCWTALGDRITFQLRPRHSVVAAVLEVERRSIGPAGGGTGHNHDRFISDLACSGPLWVTARSRKLDGGVDDRAFGGAAKPPIVAGANSAAPSCIVGATAEEKWWATAKRGDVSG